MIILALILCLAAFALVYNIVTALLGRALGLAVESVTLGAGPPLLARSFGSIRWQLAPLLFMGSVTFRSDGDPAATLEGMGKVRKIVLVLSGPVVMILCAILLLGPAAVDLTLQSVWVLACLPLYPVASIDLIDAAVAAFAAAPPLVRLGQVFAVGAGFNLLPLINLPMGMALLALGEGLFRHRLPEFWLNKLLLVSLALTLAILLVAGLGLFRYLTR